MHYSVLKVGLCHLGHKQTFKTHNWNLVFMEKPKNHSSG